MQKTEISKVVNGTLTYTKTERQTNRNSRKWRERERERERKLNEKERNNHFCLNILVFSSVSSSHSKY